ncbi:MAG: TipAS antibiotic-recognition domain-containing protein, partial [Clostridia bacterium]|nr:TipAS antibiotic-recognition domain-containing protein [Clostridia bacterium]
YRLYDEADIGKLQQILLFRELEFPLKEISKIVNDPDFDRNKALEKQIALLEMHKDHLTELISFARELQTKGDALMEDFKAFDKSKIEEYAAAAKREWGDTPEYSAYKEKADGRSEKTEIRLSRQMMDIFAAFGEMRSQDPANEAVQELVQKLQDFITEHYYHCSNNMLCHLGNLYAAGGEFTENIDQAGGSGTAAFVQRAIQIYNKHAPN